MVLGYTGPTWPQLTRYRPWRYEIYIDQGVSLAQTISLLMNTIGCSKYFFGAQILYKSSTCATKVSLLLLYLRIFTDRVFRTTAWGIIAIVIGYDTATVIVTVFQCHSIAKAWNSRIHGHCINVGASWYATAAFAITTDIAIIVLPIKQISTLRLPRAQKLGLMFLFSLGTFVIATTAIRIVSLGPSTTSSDSTCKKKALYHALPDLLFMS